MIADLVCDILTKEPAVDKYCGGRVFQISAPLKTPTPYMVVTADEEPDESGAVSVFDLTVYIYDTNEDKRPLIKAVRFIKRALNRHVERNAENYYQIRFFFESAQVVRDSEDFVLHGTVDFTARGIVNTYDDIFIDESADTLF